MDTPLSRSAFQQETHDKMFGGVDTTTRPHLVEEDTWTTAHNMVAINTQFTQVPQKVVIGTLGVPILALLSIPVGSNPSSSMVALTANGMFVVKMLNGQVTFEQMYLNQYQTYGNHLQQTNG